MFLLARVLLHKATELPWQYYEYRGYSDLWTLPQKIISYVFVIKKLT